LIEMKIGCAFVEILGYCSSLDEVLSCTVTTFR